MKKIIISIGYNPTEQEIKNNTISISNLANKCRKTDFFKKNEHQVDEFKKHIDTEYPDKKIKTSYLYLLNRIGDAPSRWHLESAIILNLPIIDDYLGSD